MLNYIAFRGRLGPNGIRVNRDHGRRYFRLHQLNPKANLDCQVLDTHPHLFDQVDDLDPGDELIVQGTVKTSTWKGDRGKHEERTSCTVETVKVFHYHGDKDGHSMEYLDEVGE